MSRFYDALREANQLGGELAQPAAEVGTRAAVELSLSEFEGETSAWPLQTSPPVAELPADDRAGGERSAQEAAPVLTPHAIQLRLDSRFPMMANAADGSYVEYYRRLRTKIVQQQSTQPFRSLLVTSPSPGDGKTVTVANLASIFALLPDRKVLAIDGDLRRRALGTSLGIVDRPGLSNLLDGSASLQDIVCKVGDMGHLITAGTSTVSAAELLHSPELSVYLSQLSEHFDFILVDSPPVNLVADAQLLASACDAVLVVARAFSTNQKAVERAMIDLLPFRVIGTVLNGGAQSQKYRGYAAYGTKE